MISSFSEVCKEAGGDYVHRQNRRQEINTIRSEAPNQLLILYTCCCLQGDVIGLYGTC